MIWGNNGWNTIWKTAVWRMMDADKLYWRTILPEPLGDSIKVGPAAPFPELIIIFKGDKFLTSKNVKILSTYLASIVAISKIIPLS